MKRISVLGAQITGVAMKLCSKIFITSTLVMGLTAFGAQKQNPTSDPTRNNPDVPHQEPGTDNPDVGKQRHPEPGTTTSTDTGTSSDQTGKQHTGKKARHKKSTATGSQTSSGS